MTSTLEPVSLIFSPWPAPAASTRGRQLLLTDGVSYWVGWYSGTDNCFWVRNADGTNGVLKGAEVIAWAPLPNYYAITSYPS